MFPFQNSYLAPDIHNNCYYGFYNQVPYHQYAYNFTPQSMILRSQSVFPQFDNIKDDQEIQQKNFMIPRRSQAIIPSKRKRITKKLIPIESKRRIRNSSKAYKTIKKSLNYLDPSRAPPITTLRKDSELQADINLLSQNFYNFNDNNYKKVSSEQKSILKLQMLIKPPDYKNYPFLICKKRKYYRSLKRRYSVAYFEQRAYYIQNKLPIPFELYPKHKNKRNRRKKQSEKVQQNQESLSSSYSDQINESRDSLSLSISKLNSQNNQNNKFNNEDFKKLTFSPNQHSLQ